MKEGPDCLVATGDQQLKSQKSLQICMFNFSILKNVMLSYFDDIKPLTHGVQWNGKSLPVARVLAILNHMSVMDLPFYMTWSISSLVNIYLALLLTRYIPCGTKWVCTFICGWCSSEDGVETGLREMEGDALRSGLEDACWPEEIPSHDASRDRGSEAL